MHPKRLEIQQRLRWLIPVGTILGTLLVGFAWFRYVQLASHPDADNAATDIWQRPIVWLAQAIVGTVALPLILLVTVRGYVWLIRHGTEVPGRVVSISPLVDKKSQRRPVTYAYSVGGVEHTMKRDTPTAISDEYEIGTPLVVLVDPRKPTHATVLDIARA